MRGYTDPDGRAWDVVVGRESFGALYAIFVGAKGNDAPPRQTPLAAESMGAGHDELDSLSQDEMNALFLGSKPKELG